MRFAFFLAAALGIARGADAQAGRPPIAAPVKIIPVNPLPVVRSQSETVDDLLSALIPALMAGQRAVQGVAFLSVRDDRVVLRKDFGTPDADKPFSAGTLSELMFTVAAMQQIEQGKLRPDDDLSGLLGQSERGATVDQLLSHQIAADPSKLAQLVEKASGELMATYIPRSIFAPLKMMQSSIAGSEIDFSIADIAQLMIALLNGGVAGSGHVLQSATIDTMARVHASVHPALPGWAYGFAEMRRNGMRAFQRDGEGDGLQTRLVLVPAMKFGYFIFVRGRASAEFWRVLDDTLFDRSFAPQDAPEPGLNDAPAPGASEARGVADVYRPSSDPAAGVAVLKTAGRRLNISAGADGTLVLSGAANAVLTPKEGGYWSGQNGNLNAVLRDGRLMLSIGLFEPLPLWQKWELYFWLGVALLLAMTGATYGRGGKRAGGPDDMLLGVGTAASGSLILALLIWLLAPI